jgi:hypothetical protein
MGFLKLIEKKKVPDELPDLITEEIKKRPQEKAQEAKGEKPDNKIPLEPAPKIEANDPSVKELIIKKEPASQEKTNEEKDYSRECKDSFFINMQETIKKEMGSLNKFEEWYNDKLLPKDTLSEMKSYWEEQKSNSMIQVIGKDLQDKITKKICTLQELEKKWQETYFSLIEKEGEIKEQEKELKKMLAEFILFCKKRMKNEKTKDKKRTPHKKGKSR